MMPTIALTIASLKMFIRSKQALFFTLVSPLIIMGIFGLIGFDDPPKFDVGLVYQNPNDETRKFIDQLKNFPTFTVHEDNLQKEMTALDEGDRAAVLEIPGDFITTTASKTPKTLIAHTNATQPAESATVLSILNQFLDKASLQMAQAPTFFNVEEKVVNSRDLNYIDFLLPGLVAMSVMQMSVFSVAFVFVQYKEKGVLKRLLATPMNPMQFVVANIITRLSISLIQAAIFIAVGMFIFDAQVIGSYFLVALSVFFGALMFLGLGFTVSGLSKTVDSVPAFANILVFPMLFLGGTFFPISSMPEWVQAFAKFLPLTYFSSALRSVMTEAAGLNQIK